MKKGLFVLASLLVMSSFASAGLTGNTVVFNDIGQDVGDYFGTAAVTGDTITFNPSIFAVGTGEPDNFLNKQLWFTIDAKPGSDIDSLEIEEFGDFTLFGNGTDLTTYVSVQAVGTIRIDDVEGVALPQPIFVQGNMDFKKSNLVWDDGTFGLVTDGPGSDGWEGELKFDIDQILSDNLIAGKATSVYFTMDNILFATAANGDVAQIEKKAVGGFVLTVPEPATMALLGLGGLLLRRKK